MAEGLSTANAHLVAHLACVALIVESPPLITYICLSIYQYLSACNLYINPYPYAEALPQNQRLEGTEVVTGRVTHISLTRLPAVVSLVCTSQATAGLSCNQTTAPHRPRSRV